MKILHILSLFIGISIFQTSKAQTRTDISLDANWQTIAHEEDKNAYSGFEKPDYKTQNWKTVNVPHNWDQYHGYRRLMHGNFHGYAWYRKTFNLKNNRSGKRFFLYFEGVGSYATVYLNGKKVGYHPGGRTTFTLDVTDVIKLDNQANTLAVRADHPPHIQDLPWVCGGCSTERGFSEGSQPLGIFRPVHLIVSNDVRIEPFGVHAWNDATVTERSARVNFNTEIKNYGNKSRKITLLTQILNKDGVKVAEVSKQQTLSAGNKIILNQQSQLKDVTLWSLENPYLYSIVTKVVEKGKLLDEQVTPYGIRWISWPIGKKDQKQFFLNGKPVFINGIAEYEHLIGNGHAFSAEQVRSRVMQMKGAGFNAFRDAHQPHNLRYHEYWDKHGILWWTQMAAHIWYDTPEFRKNFKDLLTDWVKERRNSPSIVLWGLENESTLPEDFARECTELIRSLDPTASSQRLVTTCNGGKGTDWDVPQNWTGTYGGDPKTYDKDVERQVLIGEYGAWRTLDLHTEGPFVQNGSALSEDRMTQLMEMKVRLAESAKDKTTGHFFWLFTSHDNPGRVQGGEGLRELDRVGPVNYKGLLTPWEEPLDVYYMFRANYAPKETDPMVYIVSHTWPDRWTSPGKKDSITIYSNCDEVELFNDVNHASLGKRKRNGVGTHFQWDDVNINYNVLYAKGYVNGKEVATDYIVLHHLPKAPHFDDFLKGAKPLTAPEKGYNYLYRVNCGGPDFKDGQGNTWSADRQRTSTQTWGSNSWTKDFPGTPAFFASQRRIHDPIAGTTDWKLFQDFRYGRDKLNYEFPVPDGEYLVELYFNEPWLGTGGGMDCKGMRLFDVAVNGEVLIKDLDIWKEVGHDAALKKTVKVKVKGGLLLISFPEVKSAQAVISAIAIASLDKKTAPAPASALAIQDLSPAGTPMSWMDTGDKIYSDDDAAFVSLPSNLYGAEWIQTAKAGKAGLSFKVGSEADVFVAYPGVKEVIPAWLKDYEATGGMITSTYKGGQQYTVYRKRFQPGQPVTTGSASSKAMYIVAVLPASALEPAHDLKKVISYKAVDAALIGKGIGKEALMGRERVKFNKPSGNVLEWTINTGVADTYSLTVKYHNPFNRILKAQIEVLAADGTMMKSPETFDLTPTREGKWNYFTTNTGTMINAGTYKVRLTAIDMEGVSVDALDVQ
ncbi:malectin domain-containing carbohydrate-binding protein [Desertivirga xinjiangensis]|uniref:malectin domain-containing carbohydrate-binding protein n=1 Tax=Desertivirga xinjiangensis TaxID=539206 RepID=UPI002109CE8B|nr:malectin domain-containing carbohydrate-binding protein [Pedobacter xinjiangensis]